MILAFVRGELALGTLENVGIHIEPKDDGFEIDNPWQLAVTATPRDVAKGFLAYSQTPERLKLWAGVVLAGSTFLELGKEFETTPEGDLLLNALWDASIGDEINPETWRVAEGLAAK